MKVFFTIVFSSFFVVTGLSQNPYYPLKANSSMTYNYVGMFASTSDKQSIVKVTDETKTVGGNTYHKIETSLGAGDDFSVVDSQFIRVANDGSVFLVAESDEQMVFPGGPFVAGKTWSAKQNGVEVTSKIISNDATFTADGKTFSDCLVVEMTQQETKVRSYLKKGIGMVGISVFINGEEQIMQYLSE